MSPNLALLMGSFGILIVLQIDRGVFKREYPSYSQLIPWIWLMIISSRMVSYWFNAEMWSFDSMGDGSPFDRNVLSVLIIIGIVDLARRKIDWGTFVSKNVWILLFFLYSGLSVIWSEYLFVSFKRYIKEIGNLVMVLLILSDERETNSIRFIIRRATYVLMPMSLILFKYFPLLGRNYHPWSGELSITGVTTNKNSLGVLAAFCALTISWIYLTMAKGKDSKQKVAILLLVSMYALSMWMLVKSNSKTAFGSFVAATAIMAILKMPAARHNIRSIGLILLIVISILFILQFSTDIFVVTVTKVLGRDITLTGRTILWQDLLSMAKKPLIGFGFNSFWLGERLKILHERYWFQPTEAHNSFLETYLNGGLFGVILMILVFLASFKKVGRALIDDYDFGIYRMSVFIFALLYSITEAFLMVFHLVWFMFLLVSIEVPIHRLDPNPARRAL
jgi:exopolysaccharide production protein ExoQ